MLKGIVTQSVSRIPLLFSEAGERPRLWLAVRLCLLAAAATILVRTAWVCDDAYITLRTLDHFVDGHGLRYNIAERVQAFTHPLWLFLLAVPYALSRDGFDTTLFLGLALSLLTLAVLLFRSKASAPAVALGVITLLLSRAFVDYSTSGLENPLTHALLLGFLLLLGDSPPSRRRLFRLGALAGLATLNRVDALLLFAPGLIYSLVLYRRTLEDDASDLPGRDRRGTVRRKFARRLAGLGPIAAGFAPFLLWELFSTFYYGFPYPNTAVAKLYSGIGGGPLARQGLYYLWSALRHDPVTPVTIGLALAAAALRRSGRERMIALGIALYLVYVVRIGGDFMSGRFLAAPMLAAVVLLLQMKPLPLRHGRTVLALIVVVLAAVTPRPAFTSGSDFGLNTTDVLDAHGIADERRYYFGWSGWFNGNPRPERPVPAATHDGRQLRRDHAPLAVEGAIGVTGLFAGPDLHLVDCHGLTEPLLARLPAVKKDVNYEIFLQGITGRSDSQGWRIGHFLRNVPRGYLATLLTGTNQIADPRLARFYDHLSFIIRGPLWSGRRLGEIIRMNLGLYDNLVDRAHPDYEPADYGEALRARPGVAEFYLRRAMTAQRANDYAAAEKDALAARALDPTLGAADALLGVLYKIKGDPDRMVAYWEQAVALDPDLIGVYSQLGNYWMGQDRAQKALDSYLRGLERDPTGVALYAPIARALSAMGRDREAIPWLEKSIRYTAADWRTYDLLGERYMAVSDLPAARRVLEKSIALEESGQNLFHLGLVYADLEMPEQARDCLQRSLQRDPDNFEAACYLGDLLAALGRRPEAVEYWRRSARGGFPPARDSLRARGIGW